MKKENYYGHNIKMNSNNIFNNYNINTNINTEKILKVKIHNKEYEIYDQNLIQILLSLITANGGINLTSRKETNSNKNNNITYKNNDYREYYTLKKNLFSNPKELNENSLEFFLNLLSIHLDENVNIIIYIRKLINICIYFQLYDIIQKEVNEYLFPKISKNNCIEIIINFIDLIFGEKTKKYFINLIKKGILTISYYLPDFIINKKESLFLLSKETLEEIIEKFFENKIKFTENNITSLKSKDEEKQDIKNVFNLLMYARNIHNDIFSLLENERKNALNNFENNIKDDKDCKPKFIWRIKYSDIKNEIYQEHNLCVENLNLLLINYYEPKKDIFQLALQIIGINNNKDSKNMININSSSKKENNKKLNENNNEIELNSYNNNNIEAFNKIIISDNNKLNDNIFFNCILSILYCCELSEIGFKSKINFNCVHQSCKSKFLVFKLDNFSKLIKLSKNNNKIIDFSIKFYFSRNYIFSSIINHICNNLDIYYKYFSINKIPKLALSIILKNANYPNTSKKEYYKLQLIKNWLRNKNNYNENNIIDLFKLIQLQNLSTNDLIDFFIINAKLLISIKELKNDIFYEIQRRFQNEYFNFFQNDKILQTNLYNNTESNDESLKLNIIPKNENLEDNNSFTFDFLTKILSFFSLKNIQNINNEPTNYNEINFTTPLQEGRNNYKLINQRNININNNNEIPRPKASKSIRLNESPNYNYNNININQKENKYNNLNKRNSYTNKINKSNNTSKLTIGNKNSSIFYINNLTNNKKKSSNSSLISNYHNISAKNCECDSKNRLIQNSNKKIKLNYNINHNNKIYSSDFIDIAKINGIKSSSLVTSKSSKRIINKKNHSKSVDKNNYDSSIHKNNSIPEKNKVYLFNNYLNYNDNGNGQKKYNGNEKSLNGLQKNNYDSRDDKNKYNNNKLLFFGNNNSKAKLIKTFNSPLNQKRKKNSSENKNPKIKKYNY